MRFSTTWIAGSLRPAAAIATALSLLVASTAVPLLAQETASFVGTIFDPDGRPASGFEVVLKDVVSGREFSSSPTGTDGLYSLDVPVGGKYTVVRVVAPDGTPLPVQSIPPLAVQTAGTNRLDVAFQRTAPPPPGETSDDDEEKKPWYKTPGGITGIVLGVAAVAAIAIGSDDDDPPPSPNSR